MRFRYLLINLSIPTKHLLGAWILKRCYEQYINTSQFITSSCPKGLDISQPNHIGFAQLFSQGTDSVAKTLWDSNRQNRIFPKKLKTCKYHPFAISYVHFKFHANRTKSFRSKGFQRKMKYQFTQLSKVKNKLINKQNIILTLWTLVTYSCISSFIQIHQLQM